MRSFVSAFRFRHAFQAAVVLILAGMGASCSNSLRLQEPFFTSSTENQREILGQNADGMQSGYQTAYADPGDNAVMRADLPAPVPAAQGSYVSTGPSDDYGTPSNDYSAPAVSGGAFEWSAVGGRVVTVGRNDNMDTLTAKFGVPEEQILMANQMSDASQVRPGRVIVIPRRVAITPDRLRDTQPAVADYEPVAPAADQMYVPAAQPKPAIATAAYIVQPGETLFGIARRANMAPSELASLNGMSMDTQLQVGQSLRIRGNAMRTANVAGDAQPKPTMLGTPEKPLGQLVVTKDGSTVPQPRIRLVSPAESAESGQVIASAPRVPVMPKIPADSGDLSGRQTTANIDAAADAASVDSASADGKSFRWPVRGRIISGFGAKPNGEKNDGINLAVPEGTSVKAVEAGTVIYAGNELEGYGNLVLIRHADGWVSAYAHNKDLLVKRGDTVRRGEVVAHAGMTGSVNAPQVHFELRKGAKPVNPLDYLAGA